MHIQIYRNYGTEARRAMISFDASDAEFIESMKKVLAVLEESPTHGVGVIVKDPVVTVEDGAL